MAHSCGSEVVQGHPLCFPFLLACSNEGLVKKLRIQILNQLRRKGFGFEGETGSKVIFLKVGFWRVEYIHPKSPKRMLLLCYGGVKIWPIIVVLRWFKATFVCAFSFSFHFWKELQWRNRCIHIFRDFSSDLWGQTQEIRGEQSRKTHGKKHPQKSVVYFIVGSLYYIIDPGSGRTLLRHFFLFWPVKSTIDSKGQNYGYRVSFLLRLSLHKCTCSIQFKLEWV